MIPLKIPSFQDSGLELGKIQVGPHGRRLECVAYKRGPVRQDAPGPDDSCLQRQRGRVQHHEIDLICSGGVNQTAEQIELTFCCRLTVKVYRDIQIAHGMGFSRCGAAEKIRKQDILSGPQKALRSQDHLRVRCFSFKRFHKGQRSDVRNQRSEVS